MVLVLAACSVGAEETSEPAQLASGASPPAGCADRDASADATASFVASGRAWALDPAPGRLQCLFRVQNPGPFAWGPRGDRALLARLQVKGLGAAPSRPPGRVDPSASSWGRTIGKSIVFVGSGDSALLKAHRHTGFDAITFADGGSQLYFAARHVDRRVDVHRLQLVGATSAPVVWRGGPEERVTDLVDAPGGPDLAFTTGRSCESRYAVVVSARHPKGAELMPNEERSRAVGWLDRKHVLVATGGCGRKLDLYSVESSTLEARLLVRGVDAASVRRAEQLPPPPLSPEVLGARSSFA